MLWNYIFYYLCIGYETTIGNTYLYSYPPNISNNGGAFLFI